MLSSDVGDIVPRVAVEGLFETLLVQVMADEAYGAAQNKETIQASTFDYLVGLLAAEGATTPNHINEAHCNASINIEDEVRTFFRSDLLDFQSVLQNRVVAEVFQRKLLDDLHPLVWIAQRL